MEEQSTIILRERWLPFVQAFFSTHQSRVTEAQIEQFTVEVFAYISQIPYCDPAIVLQILYHYYQDSRLIDELRRQPPGEIWVQLEITVRQQLVRSGMAKDVLVVACDRVMAQLTGAIQAHQYRTSFVMLIGAIIQQQIQEEKEK